MYKQLLVGAAVVFLVSLVGAVQIDDTYQQVLAEKGQPTGKMQAGETMILRYADQTIRLKGGKVIAVDAGKSGTSGGGTATASAVVVTSAATKTPMPAAEKSSLTWTTDYASALADAKQLNRHVFLFFTGSDWCGWCMRLNREILSTPEFTQYATENLILVELDFPRTKSQAEALKRQNESLARTFKIEGYPTVVVLDRNGRPVGRLGYQEGGPKPFVKELKSL